MVSRILNALKRILRRYPIYWEARYAYRSHTIYRKLGEYLYHRFWTRRLIQRTRQPFDRPPNVNNYSIHFLCGHRQLDMLFWSLASWCRAVPDMAQVYIHEDGTFTKRDRKALSALFPMATIIDYRASTQKAISQWLVDYPVTKGYRVNPDFIWTVKLIDPFFISTRPYVLVLDTDLLWFKKPQDLIDHLDDFQQPIFWPANSSWNFPLKGGESLQSGPLNTGLVLYESRRFQLDLIEEFCQKIGPDLGPPLLDQPGYVYTLAKLSKPAALPIERYIIKGSVQERTVAKHYTGPRREQFWFEGVRLLHKELFS